MATPNDHNQHHNGEPHVAEDPHRNESPHRDGDQNGDVSPPPPSPSPPYPPPAPQPATQPKPFVPLPLFSLTEACTLLNFPRLRLGQWVRTGVVVPRGRYAGQMGKMNLLDCQQVLGLCTVAHWYESFGRVSIPYVKSMMAKAEAVSDDAMRKLITGQSNPHLDERIAAANANTPVPAPKPFTVNHNGTGHGGDDDNPGLDESMDQLAALIDHALSYMNERMLATAGAMVRGRMAGPLERFRRPVIVPAISADGTVIDGTVTDVDDTGAVTRDNGARQLVPPSQQRRL